MDDKLVTILNEMSEYLNIAQMEKLQEVLVKTLSETESGFGFSELCHVRKSHYR